MRRAVVGILAASLAASCLGRLGFDARPQDCTGGACVEPDTQGGTCFETGTCNSDLVCNADGVCVDSSCASVTQATFSCDSDDVYWFDGCGFRAELKQACVDECAGGACLPDVWLAMGDSAFGPRSERITWGSASGGGLSTSSGFAAHPTFSFDASGSPTVAWQDTASGNSEIYVRIFDGASWQEVGVGSATGGGISDTPASSGGASLAIDASDRPVVAWTDDAKIYIRRFDGTSWEEMGAGSATGAGFSGTSGSASGTSLGFDPSGNAVVAWHDDSSGNIEIYVLRFNGTSWEEVGIGSATDGGISNTSGNSLTPSLGFGTNGNPIVAWWDATFGNDEIYVRRFNGTSWEEVGINSATDGGVTNTAAGSKMPSLVADLNGNPIVAWQEDDFAAGEIYVRRFNGTSWEELGSGSASGGGVSNTPTWSLSPSLTTDASGTPTLAWVDTVTGSFNIYVRRYSGGVWQEVGIGSDSGGGISNTNTSGSGKITLAFDPSANPAVVWSDASGIYLRRFDGSSWAELNTGSASGGGITNTAFYVDAPSLDLDASGNPMVAWKDWSSVSSQVYARRLVGASWVEVGVGSASGDGISNAITWGDSPAFAFDPNDNPVVAWMTPRGARFRVYIRRFDGSSWEELGTDSAGGEGINGTDIWPPERPAVAFDATSNPVVAWADGFLVDRQIHVRRFNGTSWEEVGTGSATAGGISNAVMSTLPSLSVDGNGDPTVAWVWWDQASDTGDIFVRRFNGTSWEELGTSSATGGGISNTAGISTAPSLGFDGNGNPVVAWEDATPGTTEIYVRRWSGTSWEEVGSGSATGGGISNTPGASASPSLGITNSGNPVVAWEEAASGMSEIYIRHFDGTAWVELGKGSASGGGLSNSAGRSVTPSLSARSGWICVAWVEPGENSTQILLRCAADET